MRSSSPTGHPASLSARTPVAKRGAFGGNIAQPQNGVAEAASSDGDSGSSPTRTPIHEATPSPCFADSQWCVDSTMGPSLPVSSKRSGAQLRRTPGARTPGARTPSVSDCGGGGASRSSSSPDGIELGVEGRRLFVPPAQTGSSSPPHLSFSHDNGDRSQSKTKLRRGLSGGGGGAIRGNFHGCCRRYMIVLLVGLVATSLSMMISLITMLHGIPPSVLKPNHLDAERRQPGVRTDRSELVVEREQITTESRVNAHDVDAVHFDANRADPHLGNEVVLASANGVNTDQLNGEEHEQHIHIDSRSDLAVPTEQAGAESLNVVDARRVGVHLNLNRYHLNLANGRPHHFHPRTILYLGDFTEPVVAAVEAPQGSPRPFIPDPMLCVAPGEESPPQDQPRVPYTKGDCVPMQQWQVTSFPTCNVLHELDIRSAGMKVGKRHREKVNFEDTVKLLGMGWFRHAWRVDYGATGDAVVLKTLRLEREFYDEFFDLHRRDAMAMERLTHSKFVMNIYGFCGQSALNELADFGKGGISSLETLARRLRDRNSRETTRVKLQMAAMIAVGVMHVHEIDGAGNATMVHYDLNPRNIAISEGGNPRLNDFNVGEFLRWNVNRNEPCGFDSRLHEPWWRSPEEVDLSSSQMLNEKVDVYALGNILYDILTGHSPRGKMRKERMEEVREEVLRGDAPRLSSFYTKSKDPAIVAFRNAMKLCFEPNPEDRASAREVANLLYEEWNKVKNTESVEEFGRDKHH